MRHNWAVLINLTIKFLLSISLTSCESIFDHGVKQSESADIYLQLGVRYLDLNKLEIAKQNLLLALDKDPNNAQIQNAYAFLCEKLEDYPKAKEHYLMALGISPDAWSIQNNYGRFLCEQGDRQQGLEILKKAFATPLNDKPWIAITNAGRCQLDTQMQNNALSYFEKALFHNSNYAPALLEMQKLSFNAGDYGVAQTYFKRYLDVGAYTPASLWIAMETEFALGQSQMAHTYEEKLLEQFPLSKEAKQIRPVLQ